MYHELLGGQLADETPVLVKFPRTKEEEQGDRNAWRWLPGTIVQQCGPDEWQVLRRGYVRGRAQGWQQADPPHAAAQPVLPAVASGTRARSSSGVPGEPLATTVAAVLIAAPAAVAVWCGWVGLGRMCGFGTSTRFPASRTGSRSTPRSRCRSASRRTARTRCARG